MRRFSSFTRFPRCASLSIAIWAALASSIGLEALGQEATTSTLGPGGQAGGVGRPSPRGSFSSGDPLRLPGQGTQQTLSELLPIYFPAPAPVLGTELPPSPVVRDPIWNELAPDTNEPFFAPLSTRLAKGGIDRRHRQRLEAYRADRAAALAELRAGLASADASPANRQGILEALATRQAQLLAGLATTADALRYDLYRGGFMTSTADWNEHRNWQLGDTGTKRSPQELLADEFSVMRAAIYYQEGLSPEQRQLLREVTVELSEALGEREPAEPAGSFEPDQVVFFLPHGSRVRLPAGLPAGLAAEIARFNSAKNALKRELRDALFSLDRESGGKREKALRELATRQAAALAALETQAERIRISWAALEVNTQPAVRPGLPSDLTARIDAYLRAKADIQDAARQQARARTTDPKGPAASPAAARNALASFEDRNRERLAALSAEARAIREELARHASSAPASEGGAKTVDALLADFMSAFKQQQLQALYRDYRRAVLEPGLSPAQRKLLFDAALAGLDLTGSKDWQAVPE